MTTISLSRDVLEWAAGRAGQSLESFALEVSSRDGTRLEIVSGKMSPRQAEKLAKAAKIPFGYLFLSQPPEIVQPEIPDLRQVKSSMPLSDDFYDTLKDAMVKQAWYAEYLQDQGADPIDFSFDHGNRNLPTADQLASNIKARLEITDKDRVGSPDADAYFSRLSAKAEKAGIMVLKSGCVRGNTKRRLSESEFRGFALPHPLAPLVFVNGNDAKVAAVFTLLHEIAHIWLGIKAVSDVSAWNNNPIEVLCNATAARVLVPIERFLELWSGPGDIERLAKHFRVSKVVIARVALDRKLIKDDAYNEVVANSAKLKGKGTPTIYQTLPVRNGKTFTNVVLSSAMGGELMLRDAARLLNVRADTVASLGYRLGRGVKGD